MRNHFKALIHNLLTQSDKLQAINTTISQTKNEQAKADIEKIKSKYFK